MSTQLIQFLKRRRWSLRRANRQPQQSRDTRPATLTGWTADVIAHSRVAAFDRVNLRGPELDDFALDLVERLATVLFDEFCEYVAARNALKLALEENGAVSDYDLERVARTQDDLMSEIDTGLLLPPAESRIVAGVLGEACGRVGIRKEAA